MNHVEINNSLILYKSKNLFLRVTISREVWKIGSRIAEQILDPDLVYIPLMLSLHSKSTFLKSSKWKRNAGIINLLTRKKTIFFFILKVYFVKIMIWDLDSSLKEIFLKVLFHASYMNLVLWVYTYVYTQLHYLFCSILYIILDVTVWNTTKSQEFTEYRYRIYWQMVINFFLARRI